MAIELGSFVKDTVSGFQGTIVSRTEELGGHFFYTVESRRNGIRNFPEARLEATLPPEGDPEKKTPKKRDWRKAETGGKT